MESDIRYCPKCEKALSLANFTQRSNGRRSSYCKTCMSLYCRHHYVKNAAKHNARRNEARRRYRVRNRAYVLDYLRTHPCIDCGESDLNVLDFDHVDPCAKFEEVSVLSRRGRCLEGWSLRSRGARSGAPIVTVGEPRGSLDGQKELVFCRDVAQVVERCVWDAEAKSSTLFIPTNFRSQAPVV
jgi:hypothetical protein